MVLLVQGLFSEPMTRDRAIEVMNWQYEPPYNFYNLDQTEDELKGLLAGDYHSILTEAGAFIGFYCSGISARVPVDNHSAVYSSDSGRIIDIGLGMKPELTGQGLGAAFLDFITNEVSRAHASPDLRLTVATFNHRAIRLYENYGFRKVDSIVFRDREFDIMVRGRG